MRLIAEHLGQRARRETVLPTKTRQPLRGPGRARQLTGRGGRGAFGGRLRQSTERQVAQSARGAGSQERGDACRHGAWGAYEASCAWLGAAPHHNIMERSLPQCAEPKTPCSQLVFIFSCANIPMASAPDPILTTAEKTHTFLVL